LDILSHSLYTEREIFLRELISNASDALTRLDFEMLTTREVNNPELPLEIRITADPEARTLTIRDTGIGMTRAELAENLGVIARSGARAFIDAAAAVQDSPRKLTDIIGQFGVGFYSAFMVAESIHVSSLSFRPGSEPASWHSSGDATFTLGPSDQAARGTVVEIKLKEDAAEFAQEHRLGEIVKKHSDFINFPIYIGAAAEQTNRQTALWRQQPRQLTEKEYHDFYQQVTLDFTPPLAFAHMVVDAPVQMYAVLYIPASAERFIFAARREGGLKLYSRKILIQDYCKDLLPEYFEFIQGVVDSEDLPLNVARESVQSNRVMGQLKKLITTKVVESLKTLARDKPEEYAKFWHAFGQAVKQGVATEQADPQNLYPLLRFHTTAHPAEWSSLDDIVSRMQLEQKQLYYILGDDDRSIAHSPHLDPFRKQNLEVIVLTDPIDSFMLLRLNKYQDFPLVNVASGDLDLPKPPESAASEPPAPAPDQSQVDALVALFKQVLGEKVTEVRPTDRLSDSPARLVDPAGAPDQSLQRVYRLLNKEFEAPKKVLEINPAHPILAKLATLPAEDPRAALVIEQLYEDALLIEGLHPDPASMIARIQDLMRSALG